MALKRQSVRSRSGPEIQCQNLMVDQKVLLIRCGSVVSKGRVASIPSVTPPLGMAYLAASLRKEHIPVEVIDGVGENLHKTTSLHNYDLIGLTHPEIIEKIPPHVGIFAFSCMFSNEWGHLKKLIEMIKGQFPQAITLLGGEHASALPEYSLQSCPQLDYVISGEGEDSIVSFAKYIFENSKEIDTLPGLTYRTVMGVQTNPKANRIQELDKIPFPAWDLVPVENYLKEGIATVSRRGKRIMPLLASRGCPYECKFCSNPQMYGNRYFLRDIEETLREIKLLIHQYKITGFEFHDLTFITKRSWVKEFCHRLIEENLNLEWTVPTTRSEAIDEEVVQLLRKSGCRFLFLTPDSGSPRMIKEMLKKVNLDRVTETAKIILKNGLILRVNIVFGFPEERHKDVWQSLLYGVKLAFHGVDTIIFIRFTPYPGSEYFKQLSAEGKLPPLGPEFDNFLISNIYNEISLVRSFSEYLSDRSVRMYMFLGYGITQLVFFLFHPWAIIGTFKRYIYNMPVTTADFLLIEFMKKKFRKKELPSMTPLPDMQSN